MPARKLVSADTNRVNEIELIQLVNKFVAAHKVELNLWENSKVLARKIGGKF